MKLATSTHWLGNMVANNRDLWIKLGNFETALLKYDMAGVEVRNPIYICGLARSGSTILLETLASLPDTVTHRYQDFPFLFTPYWWHLLLTLPFNRSVEKTERAHGDGILVSPQSPEAMEEMLWMAFFRYLHKELTSEILDENISNPDFEAFYKDHIRKLLHAHKKPCYVSKGNYNISRMAYIQRMFPDARFIIPIRDPVTHVESLLRQHKRFTEAGKADPRVVRHMSIAGHFEFGLNRKAVHMGDEAKLKAIRSAWNDGDDIRGFALQWDMTYRFIYNQMLTNKTLGKACLVIPFENLCTSPQEALTHMLEHCDMKADDAWLNTRAANIKQPDYYTSNLSPEDKKSIQDICKDTAELFGY